MSRIAEAAEHERTITQAHPDAYSVASSGDFQGWVLRQGAWAKQVVERGSAKAIIDLLDKYKASIGKGGRQFTRAEIAAMSDAEFTRLEPLIDKATAEGRII